MSLQWEEELILKERAWEKRRGKNWTLCGVGLLPYIAIVIVGAAIWCLCH
jgi:hypothetical protein